MDNQQPSSIREGSSTRHLSYTQVSGNPVHLNEKSYGEDIVSSIWRHIAVIKRYKLNELI